jgi:excisionase family DNA binding protein
MKMKPSVEKRIVERLGEFAEALENRRPIALVRKMKTTAEAAATLGLSRRQVQWLVKTGRLKAQRFGLVWLIDPEELKNYKPQPVGRPRRKR